MAALQGKLSTMLGTNSGYIQSLPAPVKKRLKALKKIQFESTKIEAQFYEEVHLLECKYHQKFEPLYAKRSTITKGEYEPNDEECDWPSESEDEDESALAKEVNEKAKLEEEEAKKAAEEKDKDVKGVPHFWLTIFKNVEMISDMIQEADEPALEALTDVTLTFTEVIIIICKCGSYNLDFRHKCILQLKICGIVINKHYFLYRRSPWDSLFTSTLVPMITLQMKF